MSPETFVDVFREALCVFIFGIFFSFFIKDKSKKDYGTPRP
jgi:hypothetical protein